MSPTEGRVARPERRWDCRRGTAISHTYSQYTVTHNFNYWDGVICFSMTSCYCNLIITIQEPCSAKEPVRCSVFLPTPNDSSIVICFSYRQTGEPVAK